MKFLLPLLVLATATTFAMETNKAPASLPGSAWKVTALAEETLLADHPITFGFDAEGNISGNASCNQFGGTCTVEGNTVKIGPLRSTRRACEPDIMQQERKFLALLAAVTIWEIGADGTLVLRSEGGEIRAEKAPDTPAN